MTGRARMAWRHRATIISAARFAVTGGIGFLVDGAVLTALAAATSMGPLWPRLISFPVALLATWYLNRVWTFRRRDQKPLGQSARYVLVQCCGAALNLAIYAAVIALGPPLLARVPILALAIASGVAMVVNYLGARRWVFAGPGDNAPGQAKR